MIKFSLYICERYEEKGIPVQHRLRPGHFDTLDLSPLGILSQMPMENVDIVSFSRDMHSTKSFVSMQNDSLLLDVDVRDLRRGFWMLKPDKSSLAKCLEIGDPYTIENLALAISHGSQKLLPFQSLKQCSSNTVFLGVALQGLGCFGLHFLAWEMGGQIAGAPSDSECLWRSIYGGLHEYYLQLLASRWWIEFAIWSSFGGKHVVKGLGIVASYHYFSYIVFCPKFLLHHLLHEPLRLMIDSYWKFGVATNHFKVGVCLNWLVIHSTPNERALVGLSKLLQSTLRFLKCKCTTDHLVYNYSFISGWNDTVLIVLHVHRPCRYSGWKRHLLISW